MSLLRTVIVRVIGIEYYYNRCTLEPIIIVAQMLYKTTTLSALKPNTLHMFTHVYYFYVTTASSSSTSCSKENPYLNTSDPTTSHSNTNTNRSDSNTQTTPPSDSECVKVFCSILATAVFLLTAVFATVICVLVVVIICKCHPKFKPKREARLVDAATSGGEEGGGVELPEHEYDIIGQVRCDRNINVKKNTAYTISSPLSVI